MKLTHIYQREFLLLRLRSIRVMGVDYSENYSEKSSTL